MHTDHAHLRRAGRRLGASLLTALLLGACADGGPTAFPDAALVEFEQRGTDGSAGPFVISATAGGRRIEIVRSSKHFEQFGAPWGRVVERTVIRVTDPGEPPVETAREAAARFERRGATMRIVRDNGTSETFRFEDGGRRLRTIAADGCAAPPGAACVDILHINVYERVP